MEARQAEVLLEKYWAGDSSLAEEQQLRDWFRHGRVPEAFEADKEYFLHILEESNEEPLGQDFDDRIMDLIDERQQSSWSRRFLNVGLRIAAVLVLTAGAFGLIQQFSSSTPTSLTGSVIEVEDPDEAFERTQDALLLISEKLGKGQSEASRLGMIGDAADDISSVPGLSVLGR
jgi:hypothetical protein